MSANCVTSVMYVNNYEDKCNVKKKTLSTRFIKLLLFVKMTF